MYYWLAENIVLRGWQKLSCVLVRRPYNEIQVLSGERFNVLLLCDGITGLNENELSEKEWEILKTFVEEQIVMCGEDSHPLNKDQEYIFYENRYVENCFWSITGRCNYRCRHCYMDAPDGKLGELSHEEACRLIDEMAECGVLKVDITGGEPFIRGDFWNLVERLAAYKIAIGKIYTNGWLLTEKVLDHFETLGLHPDFSVSFDGLGWHDWMRGIPGAEKAAWQAFQLCRERGYYVDAQCAVHRGSWNTIRETVRALANAGVASVRIGPVMNTPLWREKSEGNEISEEEYTEKIFEYIPQFFEDGMPMDVFAGGLISLHQGSKKYEVVYEREENTKYLDCHLCDAVRYSCYITPEGRLLPCMPMTSCEEQAQFPLVSEIGLRQGLSSSTYMQYVDSRVRDYLERNPGCNACEFRLRCGGGCRAEALMAGNGFWGADPGKCNFWHKGYAEKLHAVADEAIRKFCLQE